MIVIHLWGLSKINENKCTLNKVKILNAELEIAVTQGTTMYNFWYLIEREYVCTKVHWVGKYAVRVQIIIYASKFKVKSVQYATCSRSTTYLMFKKKSCLIFLSVTKNKKINCNYTITSK